MIFWVFLFTGGAIGAATRFLVSGWIYSRYGTAFPWGTLTVNVTGSFFLGVLISSVDPAQIGLRTFAGAGLLGAFTTFSTFALEAVLLVEQEQPFRAGIYLIVSICLGVAAVAAGLLLSG